MSFRSVFTIVIGVGAFGYAVVYPFIGPEQAVWANLGWVALILIVTHKGAKNYKKWQQSALLISLFLSVGGIFHSVSKMNDATNALRETDPSAYLEVIKKKDTDLWYTELESLDPEAYQAETKRRSDEKTAAAATKIERACAQGNALSAYLMSQQFVTERLKSPATANYPPTRDIGVRADGDCLFSVRAWVDSQNSFGAIVRSNYFAVLKHHPEDDTWFLQSLDIQ